MCGICGGFTKNIEQGVRSLRHRGPDAEGVVSLGKITLGHTRLAIIDLDKRSNQPFQRGNLTMVYNGELWNYVKLREQLSKLGHQFITSGDTEVVAAALQEWGTDALSRLNGMFAIAWTVDNEQLFLARDRFGEVPLHIARQRPFLFASEIKALLAMNAHPRSIEWLPPGSWARVTTRGIAIQPYHKISLAASADSLSEASRQVYTLIRKGTLDRTIADVPVCTLLSGGIDSSAVLLHLVSHFGAKNITAYTAVYNPRSHDLKYARGVASFLGVELREVKVAIPTAADMATVVCATEMPHKAQVEIGWACLHLARQMKADGFKVTYSGEGSDELWASYGFAYHGIKKHGWHAYRRDLFVGQHRKNFARCNKIFMAHSVECRLPFLDTDLVAYAVSLGRGAVQGNNSKMKAVISEAYRGKLPDVIVNRSKVAFQDGMGIKRAIQQVLPSARRFYTAEFKTAFRGAKA